LIALARIERLDLLSAVFKSVLIPPAVADEIARSMPILPTWLQTMPLEGVLPLYVTRRGLGPGEQEAIALAVETQAEHVILDDLPARRVAKAAGVSVIGTLGVLLAAKRAGLIDHLRPELDNLVRTSFFLGSQLYARLLREAGEEQEEHREREN
jgi:predicted nucleic acid-binding protein